MKHYTIKKDGKLIQPFASAKVIMKHTGSKNIIEALYVLREDGYVVKEVKK